MMSPSIEIHRADMSQALQREALQVTLLALHLYEESSDLASYIKKEMDRKNEHSWQCIVGTDFCSSVTHKSECYITFDVGNRRILLFRTG